MLTLSKMSSRADEERHLRQSGKEVTCTRFLPQPEGRLSKSYFYHTFVRWCESGSSWQGGKTMWLPNLTMRHCDGGSGAVVCGRRGVGWFQSGRIL